MPIYTLTLQEKHNLAKNTVRFRFNKPENFTFIPGQYGGFTLIHPKLSDEKGNTRRFSILSAPNDAYLDIATRIQSSAFKQNLNSLTSSDTIKFAGPTGNFILPTDEHEAVVLIAGGIGIAPFYSMLREAYLTKSQRSYYLFYGNLSFDTTVLFDELSELARLNSHFHFIPSFEQATQDWSGETGYITHNMLTKYLYDTTAFTYYVCGAPAMVSHFSALLAEMGIDNNKIKVEDFPGY